jgi:hypothetical protein
LVLLNSRAIIENRYINEGANKTMVMHCIEYLLSEESPNVLAPTQPHNYRMYVDEKIGKNHYRAMMLFPFLVLLGLVFYQKRKYN